MGDIYRRCLATFTAILLALTGLSLPTSRNTVSAADTSLTISIPTIEIELRQLVEDHYMITVPFSLPDNNGLDVVQCGASWYTDQLTVLGARNTGSGLMPMFSYSKEKDFIWISGMGQDYTENELCSVTFQINENVQAGDFLPIQGEEYDLNGNPAVFAKSDMVTYPVTLVSGGIRIVDSVIPAVDVAIGDVAIEQATLEENDYIVEVPVTATANNGFYGMRFGVSWDASLVSPEAPSGNVPTGLSLIPSFSASDGTGWLQLYADSTYTGSNLCTLRFRLPENAKPGNVFEITAESMSSAGTNAMVINSNGEEGTLNLKSGRIMVKSTQPVSSYAYGKVSMPTIDVTPEELAENNYQVKYPIYISKNSAFTQLEFGASWDTADLQAVETICDDAKNLGMNVTFDTEKDAAWFPFAYQGNGAAYTNTPLCTVTFTVRPDAVAGDMFTITAQKEGYQGAEASIINTKGEAGSLSLVSGGIRVVTEAEKNSEIGAKVGDVEVTMEQLENNDYEVNVPLTITKNSGFFSLSFGVSWDTAQIEPQDAESFDRGVLGLQSTFYAEQDMVWLSFISIDPYSDYIYAGDKLGDLTLLVSEDVQPGDVIPIMIATSAKNGSVASALNAQDVPTIPLLQAGSIRIAGEPITTTPTEILATGTTETTETTTSFVEDTEPSGTGSTETDTTETTASPEGSATETTSTTTVTTVSTTTATTVSTTIVTTTTRNREGYLSNETLTILTGKTATLTFQPGVLSSNVLTWISRDPNVASLTISSDKKSVQIRGISEGITTIMLLCGEKTYYCEVSVNEMKTGAGSGDVDFDGVTDMADLVMMNQYILGAITEFSAEALSNADINKDGFVDCKDALQLMQILTADET